MSTEQVQATITVKSENFHQTFDETVSLSPSSYENLIAANERLRVQISKVLTEFVEKARATAQQSNGDQKKRKMKSDEDNDDADSTSDHAEDDEDNNEDDDEEEEEPEDEH